ncbi:FeS-binding protein [Thermodesulfobacteriota bacterium]
MMKTHSNDKVKGKRKGLKWLYKLTFIVMAFTGFGQMPIFKRYYIADIPGMGWAAKFFVTHYIHYIGAIFLIALVAYTITIFFLEDRKVFKLTASAYIRILFLGAIVVTGIFRVLKNLPDIVFSPGFTQFIDISHLGFMMCYLLAALIFLISRSGWITEKSI